MEKKRGINARFEAGIKPPELCSEGVSTSCHEGQFAGVETEAVDRLAFFVGQVALHGRIHQRVV